MRKRDIEANVSSNLADGYLTQINVVMQLNSESVFSNFPRTFALAAKTPSCPAKKDW